MPTAFTKESKPKTQFTKETKPSNINRVYLQWTDMTMQWTDEFVAWQNLFTEVFVQGTQYKKETKP